MRNFSIERPEPVIVTESLSRSFGPKAALRDVSLSVPRGAVFGLVGQNGAGKSTLIKHLLGLWRAQSGAVRVFGLDPVKDPVRVLGRIGYLSEQPDLPEWMRVHEFMRYIQAFYPKWDPQYAEELRMQFGLDPKAQIRVLSKGQRAKLGLLAAQAHRPDLLLLDEPSSGLDPVVRNDILSAVIRTVADEGRTVFFSSHLLEEIERVCDHIAMLQEGRLVFCGALDDIKARYRHVVLRFENHQSEAPVLPGAIAVQGSGREWNVICDPLLSSIRNAAVDLGARIVEQEAASLNEIFIGLSASQHAEDSLVPSHA